MGACDGESRGGVLISHGCGDLEAFAARERPLALRVHVTLGERHRGGVRCEVWGGAMPRPRLEGFVAGVELRRMCDEKKSITWAQGLGRKYFGVLVAARKKIGTGLNARYLTDPTLTSPVFAGGKSVSTQTARTNGGGAMAEVHHAFA